MPTLNCRFHRVTNQSNFLGGYIFDPSSPPAGTFTAQSGVRLHLASVSPVPVGGFFPGLSMDSTTNAAGNASFEISPAMMNLLRQNKLAYFVAYRQVATVNVLNMDVDVFEPIYRCAPFDITNLDMSVRHNFYYSPYDPSSDQGMEQSTVDGMVEDISVPNVTKLKANIGNGHLSISGNGSVGVIGTDFKFKLRLRPSTSSDLSRFAKGSIKDLETNWCLQGAIQSELDKALPKMMKTVNKAIQEALVDNLVATTGQSKATVESFLSSNASITFRSFSYPVVETRTIRIGTIDIPVSVRALVPRVSIGFPRSF